ncbi:MULTISPECIES: EAL domain-containing protein [unclassified Pseudomonas]|jgi:EAL domain-containing protein (putative c-di-GMP-specific phosphodiesterase class I)/CheY-like chemotaxis protein|uniref:EAL domain-containing response regulator n=1 Tax=unclassified Pseudomonas TaxID=196821 RepID=UPI000C86E3FB|nr:MULTISPECIES: EAL domain-containing response regulator [unclassified Pseudomonas]PMU18959.1 diguanylate phosphodiesterase [Pseudomonas sp. GP01-A9]PMU26500.1 diguanylate phosphodiesterase [Pseudomonas sp. GP01-A13]PMU35381.1 diguanylate phosphodiesterase [Pseudomonas sp. GP01-A8]PMU51291.1 diguanylate phosphodiesterase [Pseudomonas sp. GP01-A14]PMU52716.1 diguanylate phosphodiesterase [Pseudomonas sp. GP01-A6]
MAHPRVLVLENQRFQRSVLIKMLDHLGVRDVVQASNGEQALEQIQKSGGVDIVLCDLADRSLDCLGFLRSAARSGMVRAVALCSELRPELRRSLEQMDSLSGLQLLGVMKPPVQISALSKMLHRYAHRRAPPALQPSVLPLPSEEEIHRGLALGEFRAWFQPKFELDTGELAGVEALARWEHPAKGLLLPADFLAAVMAYDLIDQMFKQLLEQGLNLLGVLRRQEVQLELSFNLHASQLISDQLVEHIQWALGQHDFPGNTLMFELAENGLLDISPRIQDNLLRLRMLGCGLSVDDFGMGFSSLRLLCQLPFNQLKLDGEIVRNIREPRSQAMIASTLALAQSLDMSLVIEGVSSQRIRDTVTKMGCKFGQGFYLARPMEGYRLLPWIEAHEAGLEASIN